MWIFCKIILLLCILQNIQFWPTIFFPNKIILVSVAIISILSNYHTWCINRKNYILLLIISSCLAIQSIFIDGISNAITVLILYSFGVCIYLLKDDLQKDLLIFVTKTIAILLIPGIIGYILWWIMDLPSAGTLIAPFGYGDFQNYIFFIIPYGLVPRFSGPFIEPGHISMLASFLLYAYGFKVREYPMLWTYIITIIISLSLAGYILLLAGLFLSRKIDLRGILTVGVMIIVLYVSVTSTWGEGGNIFNENIIERLEFDEEKGIAGNNRNNYNTDQFFHSMCQTNKILYGIGMQEYEILNRNNYIGGAGITMYLIWYGIIGLSLVFLYYFIIVISRKDKLFGLGFLVLISLCFLQRAYPSWTAWLIPFICSFSLYHNKAITNDYLLYS